METAEENLELRAIAVLIAAWKPDEKLLEVVESLSCLPFAAIVVVDDGSGSSYDPVFDRLRGFPRIQLLRHDRNRGLGRAQKTAFQFVLEHLPHLTGVVTADADGQHAPADIVRLAGALAKSSGRPVLGTRCFGPQAPLRSRFGNSLTRFLFRLLSGCAIRDTQCGLRGFPLSLLPELIAVEGERFEFVSSVLAHLCLHSPPPIQLPVQTIYLQRNRSSHFRPLRDSARIYALLFRFYAAQAALAAARRIAGRKC